MKRFAIGLIVVLVTASGALAKDPWKVATTSAGIIYTDVKGMTLYVLDKDTGKSTCYDKCAAIWPPFKAAVSAKPSGEWTILERKDGSKMWAYEGHPLYTYVKDKKPGSMKGEGVKDDFGEWHAAKAD